ncbi:hypothetical protein LZ189_20965, partial [Rhodovulum sulfidophilum]|nr:hypothetical protein [Rhodovulum sulfidophilum]
MAGVVLFEAGPAAAFFKAPVCLRNDARRAGALQQNTAGHCCAIHRMSRFFSAFGVYIVWLDSHF